MPTSPENIKVIDVKSEEVKDEDLEKWLFENGKKPESAEKDPFDRHWEEGVKKLKEKYLGAEISKETKDEADNILEKEEENAKLDFVREWLKDHEAEYPQTKEMTEERKIAFALIDLGEKNPLNELKNNEDTLARYSKHAEKMDDLYVLRDGIKKNPLDPESQFLALNYFYKKAEESSEVFHAMEKNPDKFSEEEIETSKKEWFRHSKIVRELTEKVTGRDPKERAEKETEEKSVKEKQDFIDSQMKRLEEIKLKRYNQILENLSEEEKEYFKAGRLDTKAGGLNKEQILAIVGTYGVDALRNIKHKNWFSNKILLGGKEIESENLDKFLAEKKQELDDKIKRELEEGAEFMWKKETRKEVGKKFDKIIKEIATSEKAEELIREKYKAVKDNMMKQFEKEAETKKATKEKNEKKPELNKESADSAIKFLELGAKKPEEIDSYLKEHGDEFCDLLGNAGMHVDKKIIKKFVEKPKNRKSLSIFIKRFVEFMTTTA